MASMALTACNGKNANSNSPSNTNANDNANRPLVYTPPAPIKPQSPPDPNFVACNPYFPLVPGSLKKFSLVWKQGSTVVASSDVERKAVKAGDGTVRYPDLERRIADEWQAQGVHRAATDSKLDEAVLHTSNTDEFGDVVAVIDAIGAQRRERRVGSASAMVPAFNVTFAAN